MMKFLPILLVVIAAVLMLLSKFAFVEQRSQSREEQQLRKVETGLDELLASTDELRNRIPAQPPGSAPVPYINLPKVRLNELRESAGTIRTKVEDLRRETKPQPPRKSEKDILRLAAQGSLTFIILLIAPYIILNSKRYTAEDKNWAYGALGGLVGYWFN